MPSFAKTTKTMEATRSRLGAANEPMRGTRLYDAYYVQYVHHREPLLFSSLILAGARLSNTPAPLVTAHPLNRSQF